ncbi:MAG: type III-B CRISPR-associated protein Cas10/Cmr2, partial [Bacteroidota bacterium]
KKGFDLNNPQVFESLNDGSIRIPSLLELGMTDLRKYESYQSVVKEPIDTRVIAVRKQAKSAKHYFNNKEENQLYIDLKKALKVEIDAGADMPLVLRHKYVAVVVADGDSIGREVSRVSEEGSEAIRAFSRKLAAFSRKAVKKIVAYQGLPVYAGGDDLFFVAPVVNLESDAHNVLHLCHELDELFAESFGDGGPTLSFGVSISYYKFPLGEAVSRAYELEGEAKDFVLLPEANVERKKNTIRFEIRKHSGQQFGGTIPLRLKTNNDNDFFDQIRKVLQPQKEAASSFLTSFMHKAQTLPSLLAEALKHDRAEQFRIHHFNEGGKHDKDYLKDALALGESIFDTHGTSLHEDVLSHTEQKMEDWLGKNYIAHQIEAVDFHHIDLLFALLRFKQFTVQDDHD